MEKENLQNSFPKILEEDVLTALSIVPFEKKVLIPEKFQEVILNGENLFIPTRVYFNEPNPKQEITLNELQQVILNCIYLRHHNGYVRQKRLNALSKGYYFAVPFAFQLLGEYVIEIITDLDKFIDETNIHLFRRFLSENAGYSAITKHRMISYWDVYYRCREDRNIKQYVGRRIFDRLEGE